MERWSDIIDYVPEPEPKTFEKTITCCNCDSVVEVTQKWSKCEGCGYYCSK